MCLSTSSALVCCVKFEAFIKRFIRALGSSGFLEDAKSTPEQTRELSVNQPSQHPRSRAVGIGQRHVLVLWLARPFALNQPSNNFRLSIVLPFFLLVFRLGLGLPTFDLASVELVEGET